ncbi:MAG: hypothetical protein EOM54_06650 [Clostridia bacterium]|nr:hypothetical protein [Clostridia bacterium]NCC69068.1 hypothetical protein [Clostridia bacterium]
MIKKLLYIFLAAAAACFLLPFCFGLWSEGLTVGAHIIMAAPEPTVSICCEPTEEPERQLLPAAQTEVGDEEPPFAGDAAELSPTPAMETGTDDGQSGSDGGEADISPETPSSVETEPPPTDDVGEEDASETEAPE